VFTLDSRRLGLRLVAFLVGVYHIDLSERLLTYFNSNSILNVTRPSRNEHGRRVNTGRKGGKLPCACGFIVKYLLLSHFRSSLNYP
jgi:hypothetical protein